MELKTHPAIGLYNNNKKKITQMHAIQDITIPIFEWASTTSNIKMS